MSENNEITLEEKINYVYDYVIREEKRVKRASIIKRIVRIVIISYIVIAMYYYVPMIKNLYSSVNSMLSVGTKDQKNALPINEEQLNLIKQYLQKK